MAKKKNYAGGMIIDGIAASEAIDSSGEVCSIEGADITSLKDGTATLNWEHRGDDAPDHTAADHVGVITFAKKIFAASDCDNDRERMYWDEVKLPFIYIKARLYDGAGHQAASELAAQIRDHHLNGEPILVRYSIEGSTITQEGNVLKETICKRVAATIKPCNRSCHSGVLEDPNSPFEQTAEEDSLKAIKKRERDFEHPIYSRLSVSVSHCNPWVQHDAECETLQKALTGGGADAAPSTLVQSDALARESLLKKWKNDAMALFRSWDGDGSLRSILKSKMPEASEEFIDHFADLVDEFKLGKLRKAAKPPKPPTPATEKPSTDWSDAEWDPKRGALRSNGREFRAQTMANDPKFGEAMKDPRIREVHGRAMHNWSIGHKMLSKGKVLPGVLIAAALNAGYSGNETVPIQELGFAHTHDLFDETTYNILAGPMNNDQESLLRQKFGTRVFPKWMREWFQAHPEGVTLGADSKPPRQVYGGKAPIPGKKGDPKLVGKPDDKIDTVQFYHRIHPVFVRLLDKHGADGRAVAHELIKLKYQYDLWKSRAQAAAQKQGKSFGIDEKLAFEGPAIEQLLVKTLRYAVAMTGAGNMVVPDTHFIRHFFGLSYKHPDNEFIKNVLLDPRNADVLDQIDQWYTRHHPAAKAVRELYFKGKDHPMVTFPAFWLHWLSIPLHDKIRKLPGAGLANNEGTAHDPFFKAVSEAMEQNGVPGHEKIIIKSEGAHSQPLPVRVALATEQIRRECGEGGALLAYWAYMAPLLHDVEAEHLVAKFEDLTETVLAKADKLREKQPITFNGHAIRPGAAEGLGSNVKGKRFDVLHRDAEHVFVVPHGGGMADLQKWPLHQEGSHFRVMSNPVPADTLKLDAQAHGLPEFMRHPEQSKLIDGMDLSGNPENQPAFFRPGINMFSSAWWKTGNGKPGYVKTGSGIAGQPAGTLPYSNEFSAHKRSGLFYNMAKDYFGLGKYVPTTVVFRHPKTGDEASVMEQLPDAEHAQFAARKNEEFTPGGTGVDRTRIALPPHQLEKINQVAANGDLHKLMMMDLIMGHDDRHANNYMFSKNGIGLHDNDLVLNPTLSRYEPPAYIVHHTVSNRRGTRSEPVHPQATQWLRSLDPMKLVDEMRRHGVPEKLVLPSLLRLEWLQQHAAANPNLTVGDVIDRAQDVNPKNKLGDVIAALHR